MIEFLHASRWHGHAIAVNDVTASIPPGITGLLGPNGSGKSTLMKLAAGVLRPSQGEVLCAGRSPWSAAGRARIGYMPDGPAPWRELPALDCVARAARLGGLDPAEAAVAAKAALTAAGLTGAPDRPVETFSHGMQQRVKFAIATVHRPEILLLDEPMLGTDPVARQELLAALRAFAREGRTVLFSTHVLPDVEAVTDRILLLHHGRLLAHGPIGEIRTLLDRHPRTIRVTTTHARELGRLAWSLPATLAVEETPLALLVRTRQPATLLASLQQVLATGRIPFTAIEPTDESVEAVFDYLVGAA